MTYRRTNHKNLHVRGYKEEGTTTTPFDMVVLNDLDRFHLVEDVIDRLPQLGSRAAYFKQAIHEKLIEHKEYIERHGDDMPAISGWKWGLKASSGPRAHFDRRGQRLERVSQPTSHQERLTNMSDASKQDWTKPAAMAIPKGGFNKDSAVQGRYGPIFPRTPACYGFSILAKIIPGREEVFYEYARNIEEAVAGQPDVLAVLKLHYLRWVLFPIKGETYFMYQGIFDTDFDKYTEDAVGIFASSGLNTVFENLEGFPMDWKTNAPAFIKFVREHHCPSFLEYGEYPYVSADEIKKALKLKAAFSDMLDQMQ